ncbi:ferrichrome/ferrioxamine B periplasmic transporter [Kluyvera cryocrescens]|uniref:Ferrichrome/ferrioxamine B periplasmic transporter n=1 Tax=Kluyvera cryocrescens TaxID=580 RepID=A0A485CFK5_KLUCR|nr:ferrichrome/ferrioxamine B periplasmic transporter [Kluyvera cryocrescens]
MKKAILGAALLLSPLLALAQNWPVTVTDLDNRTVTIAQEPQRIILQDGRDILTLAVLERENPFAKVVAWNNLPKKQDSETWNVLKRKWPEADKILDMKFSDQGNVDLETILSPPSGPDDCPTARQTFADAKRRVSQAGSAACAGGVCRL